jgi:hypothetical protein
MVVSCDCTQKRGVLDMGDDSCNYPQIRGH